MSMFIQIELDPEVASQAEVARKLVEICPVDIFAQNDDQSVMIVEDNLDECTLCDLCIEACPAGTIRIIKLYEENNRDQ